MAFTIYTVSDPAAVSSVMTSMAMFFGQDSWVGTLVKLGLLISLIIIMGKGVVANSGLRLDIIVVQLIVVWVAFLPKTTVTIEQFDNAAAPRVVDDVPIAIAVPGSLAGSFALYMTRKIETVMSSAVNNYMSVGGEVGMFTPAKTLMNVVGCAHDPGRCMNENFMQTLYAAARYCGGAQMSNADFHRSRNVFESFSAGLTENQQTVIYSEDYPYSAGGGAGRSVMCDEARSYISQVGAELQGNQPTVFAKTLSGIAKVSEERRYIQYANNQPSSREWEDALGLINRVTNSSMEINTLAIANVMSFSIADQLAKSSKSNIDRVVEIKRDAGLFDWAKAEADSSFMVTTTAPKFMDILFFIFIAATPIVMFVAMANPESGVKVVSGYVLFGLWTQSWIPMMAIITAWYQNEMQNYPVPGTMGFSAEYMAGYLRHVYTSTIVASNMLQASPYMMFAIMSGSMFALSNMIAKAAPSVSAGSAAEGGPAGGGGKPNSGSAGSAAMGNGPSGAAHLAQVMGGMAALSGSLTSNSFAGGANVPGAMGGTLPNFSTSGGAEVTNAAADAKVAETSQQAAQASEQSWGQLFSMARSGKFSVSSGSMAQAIESSGYSSTNTAGTGDTDSVSNGTGLAKTAKTNSQFGLSGAVRGGVSLGSLLTAVGKAVSGKQSSITPSAANAAERGSLSAIEALSKKAENALAAGDATQSNQLMKQLESATAAHDAKYGGGKDSVIGSVGNILSKAVRLEAEASAQIRRSDDQGVQLGTEERGTNQKDAGTKNAVTTESGKKQTRGNVTASGNEYSATSQEVENATKGAKESFQNAEAARQAQSKTRSATTSSGASSNSTIKGDALVAAWGNTQGADAKDARQAMTEVMKALTPALGGAAAGFQQKMEANFARLDHEGKGQTMSNNQRAAAAAVEAINSMMQSGNTSTAATGFAALATMAEQSNMGGALNSAALVEAVNLVNEVGDKINATNASLAPGAQATKAEVEEARGAAAQVTADAKAHNRDSKDKAESGKAETEGKFGSSIPEGKDLQQELLKGREELAAKQKTDAYTGEYNDSVKDMDIAPSSSDAGAYVGGAEDVVVTSIPLQKPESAPAGAIDASVAHGSEVAGSVAADVSGATSRGGSTAGQVSAGIPTTGGNHSGGGASHGGGSGAVQSTAQSTTSKPNSGTPGSQNKGSAPMQGR